MIHLKKQYTVSTYLLDRLHELGIEHIFGIPGDYNLAFLDDVVAHENLKWIGNCNELNAAYAADGYARIKGIAALITTFGVGELSAINGIAGSYAENVPVIKITGTPPTKVMENGAIVHHTLGDGKFDHFSNMYREITVAQTNVTPEHAAEEIDRVLRACWNEKRPVHINLPIDVYNKPINKPTEPILYKLILSNKETLDKMLLHATSIINNAKKPVILADFEVDRFHAKESLHQFVEKTGFPIATFSMGKGIFPEKHPQFIGVYTGDVSSPYLRKRIDESDCIISIGVKLTDTITGGFTQGFTKEQVIEIHPYTVKIIDKKYGPVVMQDVLQHLSDSIEHRNKDTLDVKPFILESSPFTEKFIPKAQMVTQKRFWQQMYHFLQENDVLIVEQGTPFFGSAAIPLPNHTAYVGQPLWGSIGYTLPALLGTQLANLSRRNILIIGDGSFQVTAQELSTILRQNLKPIIFLINNNGYTVERAIHGQNQLYNDIQMWDYNKLSMVFGSEEKSLTFKVENEAELAEVLTNITFNKNQLIFIEVIMSQSDQPELLAKLGKRFGQQNS
ncbi:alpha-keto acid decarboxylase family protein [Bacillus thuringiensis]|uniref:alpha-keto acid decarboxylase family protein n=1 Tax=Bacillus thuringiensis TaxID=1428 RepID=UPI000A3BD625|nr:alpha-keto acid decarboxylase family protein [Bacillus thuringiensis]MED3351530.1 alpha-keto acid decarboxylase family protein [Bacillus thuringiensis]OTW88201.1 indolepyruvate decarboxylase [Bacillus thuringiensis serovar sumiyoshiensis]OTW93881.1 indolepyruvate decarboxylase [Bacillus thuringiensis serovar fukuokaensis]PEB10508.1 indolepyruvate decarboxylase [Bacillus thuringiensis]PEB70083.1 indolepyruvate decarboxylase [Bacillus thuringiensis]